MRMRVRMVHVDSGGVRLADKTLLFVMLFGAKSAACYTGGDDARRRRTPKRL